MRRRTRAPRPRRIETRAGVVYRYEYHDYEGKHRSITFGPWRKPDDKRACRLLWDELEKRTLGPVPTLAEYIQSQWLPPRMRKWADSVRTQRTMVGAIKNLIADRPLAAMPLDLIERVDLQSWLAELHDENRAKSSVRQGLYIVRSCLAEAVDLDWRRKDPSRKLVIPAFREAVDTAAFTRDEFNRLTAADGPMGLPMRIMLYGGLRPGELAALKVEDFDSPASTLMVSETAGARQGELGPDKTRHPRLVALPPGVASELRSALPRSGRIFLNPSGRPWLVKALTDALRETALACGVDGFTSRRCRATCATLIGDPSDAQAQLGHADAAMTMKHYRRAVPERLRARLAEIERETRAVARKRRAG